MPASPLAVRSQARRPSESPAFAADPATRATGALALCGIALIHFLDVFSKFSETPYLGVAYLALIAACLGAGAALLRSGSRLAWLAAVGIAAATMAAYTASRAVGLPAASVDVGNWTEPLGLASLFAEGLVVLLGAYAVLRAVDDGSADAHDQRS